MEEQTQTPVNDIPFADDHDTQPNPPFDNNQQTAATPPFDNNGSFSSSPMENMGNPSANTSQQGVADTTQQGNVDTTQQQEQSQQGQKQPELPFETVTSTPTTQQPAQEPVVSAPAQTNASNPVSQPATQTANTMPSEVDAYKPLEQQAQIAEISPGKFDNLTKVLNILKQGNPAAITIKDSFIHENISGAILVADVNSVFDNPVNFQITDPKKHIDLFKQFKGNNNVFILDDPDNVRYILTNGPIKIFLPKQLDQLVAETTAPDISNTTTICSKTINKEIRDDIKGLSKYSTSIEFLIQQNQIKAIHIPDTGIYRFPEFIKDPNVAKLDETNADLVLKSEVFLPVDSDVFNIRIVQDPQTNDYISVTECNAGIVKMWIFEQLENTTGGTIKF